MSAFSSFYHSGNASLGIVRGSGFVDLKSDDINTDIHDYLKSDMGDQRYRELKKSENLRLQNIYIRSRAALNVEAEKKGIVNHDSMVVELIVHEGAVYHIHAEKVMDDSGRRDRGEQVPSGIVIKWMKAFHFNRKLDVKYECFGSPIGLKQVLEVLKTPPPRYDLIEANCWQYAATATRDLIKKLMDMDKVEDDDGVRRGKMQRVLDAAQKHLEDSMTVVQRSIGVGIATAAAAGALAALAATAMVVSSPDPPPKHKNRN